MKAVIYAGLVTFSLILIYVIAYSLPMSLFSYHPLLILVALVSITEGITTIQSKKIVSEENKSYHGLLQGIGFTAMTFGFSVIYYNKNLNSKPHFTTTHGQLGSIAFTFMLIQLVFGTLLVYVPSLVGGIQNSKSMYKYHRISGYILLVLLWMTAYSGVQTPFLLTLKGLEYVYLISITAILFGVGSLIQTRKLGLKKKQEKEK